MQCREFDDRLQQVLDRRAWPASDNELRRHAAHCGNCRESLTLQLEVLRVYGATRQIETRRGGFPNMTWAFAAAGLVAILALSLRMAHTIDSAPKAVVTAASTEPDLSEWKRWLEIVRHVDLAATTDAPVDASWLQPVRGGFVPLANCFASTFNVLKRTWPSSAESAVVDAQPAG